MPDFHVAFRDRLHAVNLRHGTDGFTSPPKEGVLRIFSPRKIRRLRLGFNPRTWVPKASTLPLDHRSRNKYGYFRVQSGHGTNDSGVKAVSDHTITVTAQSEFDKNYCAPTLQFTLRKTILEMSNILYSLSEKDFSVISLRLSNSIRRRF